MTNLVKQKKPFLPTTRRGWVATVVILLFVLSITGPIYGPLLLDWRPIQGRSMWPTIRWMLHWPFFSGYVHIIRGRLPKEGNIVVFGIPGKWWQWECKRVSRIRGTYPNLDLWLSTDNLGVTGEGSDFSSQYSWVPLRCVIGVVDKVWTPERVGRGNTAEGRWLNELALSYVPSTIRRGPGRQFVAQVGCSNWAVVDDTVVLGRFDTTSEAQLGWTDSQLVIKDFLGQVPVLYHWDPARRLVFDGYGGGLVFTEVVTRNCSVTGVPGDHPIITSRKPFSSISLELGGSQIEKFVMFLIPNGEEPIKLPSGVVKSIELAPTYSFQLVATGLSPQVGAITVTVR